MTYFYNLIFCHGCIFMYIAINVYLVTGFNGLPGRVGRGRVGWRWELGREMG
jgi:hypothetical protein